MRSHNVCAGLALLVALAAISWCDRCVAAEPAMAVADDANESQPAGTPTAPADAPAKPAELSSRLIALRDRLRGVLNHYSKRTLNTAEHTAWEAMHWVIAQGIRAEVRDGGPDGDVQSAIGWLCYNRAFQGNHILTLQNGRPIGVIGVGLQGHHGQLLAILAQARLRRDYPMHVGGQWFKVTDLIENEKLTCRGGTELTFKLIALSHYLTTDATWKDDQGEEWSIPRLVREEIGAPIQGAACGGTHRLMGLSHAVRKRKLEDKPLDGEFGRANKYLQDYHRYAFQLQNPDGSFSTRWLEHREARADLERRLQTSGHILEWLVFSLNEEELRQPDTVRAVEYLTHLLDSRRDRNWSLGPLGHGLHALALYDQRAFRPLDRKDAKPAATDVREQDFPPARAPAGAAANQQFTGEKSILVRRPAVLRHAQRSVAPRPAPTPGAASPKGETGLPEPAPRPDSDAGPLWMPPCSVLK